ncbi:hypothetical protein ACLB1Q_31450 [Escherichia coli]
MRRDSWVSFAISVAQWGIVQRAMKKSPGYLSGRNRIASTQAKIGDQ